MMNETLRLAPVLVTGVLLGVMFFGGLWWTVRKGVSSQRPALWFFGSLLLRMSIALAGFYFVSDGQWERLLVCLFGFVTARLIVTRFTRSPVAPLSVPAKEACHEPESR
jgi:F1F0 ATPase subunit 2